MSELNSTNQADAFGTAGQTDAFYEAMLKLKETDPEKFAQVSPSERMALGFWLEQKKKGEKQ